MSTEGENRTGTRGTNSGVLTQQLDGALEQMPHGFYLLDEHWRITFLNPVAARLLRKPREQLLGRRIWDVLAATSRQKLESEFRAARDLQEPRHCEFYLDTMGAWFESYAYPSASGVGVYFQTITERKRNEAELKATNRALTLLSRGNEVLIHAQGEKDLLDRVCRLAVEIGGYVMAWAGYARDDDYRWIEQMAHAGRDQGYLRNIRFSWSAERLQGQGPAGMAIRTGEPVFLADIGQHAPFRPWLEQARQRGYGGLVGLPLKDEQRTFGVLMLYKDHTEPFLQEEQRLLRDLAADVAFGLHAQRLRERERKLQQAVIRTSAAVSAQSDTHFFEQMALNMTAAVGAVAGVLARINPERPGYATSIAAISHGALAPNFSFDLRTSVCHGLLENPEVLIPEGLEERFPDSPIIRNHGAQAYAGQRLSSAGGETLGVLSVLFDTPPEDTDFVQSTLRIFAAGAAAELERQAAAARIHRLAYEDATTTLPNRALFQERLQQELTELTLRAGGRLAVLFMDLNRFKEINDSQGHLTGDLVLREVAKRFRSHVRQGETLARLGGDEFVFMAPVPSAEDAIAFARRLLNTLAEPVKVAGQAFPLDASIGIALAPDHGTNADALLQHTDIAMYQAKTNGGGYCVFRPAMAREIAERVELAKRFAAALRGNRLEVHYQPQVDLATGAAVGAEALLRWHDPDLGWVSPGRFIPIAEERRMMDQVGDWVLARVSSQIAEWEAEGRALPGRIAVNMAAQQLEGSEVARRFQDIIHGNGACTAHLSLELTETGIMHDPDQAVTAIQSLSDAGFVICIDDFGTGYSSLAHLKRFPVQGLKIDLSFVRDMLEDSNDHAIVNTIIAMARTMGLQTVAEGVETAEQAQRLRQLGCEQAQGYFYGRPAPAKEFAQQWLNARRGARRQRGA